MRSSRPVGTGQRQFQSHRRPGRQDRLPNIGPSLSRDDLRADVGLPDQTGRTDHGDERRYLHGRASGRCPSLSSATIRWPAPTPSDAFRHDHRRPALAGGPTEIGSMRNVQLRREDKVIRPSTSYDFLLKGDKSHDVILQAGTSSLSPSSARTWARGTSNARPSMN